MKNQNKWQICGCRPGHLKYLDLHSEPECIIFIFLGQPLTQKSVQSTRQELCANPLNIVPLLVCEMYIKWSCWALWYYGSCLCPRGATNYDDIQKGQEDCDNNRFHDLNKKLLLCVCVCVTHTRRETSKQRSLVYCAEVRDREATPPEGEKLLPIYMSNLYCFDLFPRVLLFLTAWGDSLNCWCVHHLAPFYTFG